MPKILQDDNKLRKALSNKAQFLLDHKNDPEALRKIFTTLPGRLKLLLAPDLYAEDAIAELTRQLESARSPKKIRKLVSRIAMWKTALDQMKSIETEEQNAEEETGETKRVDTGGTESGIQESLDNDSGRSQDQS
jgi:hypothetical protein